jgi:hypothetical protein
MLRPCSPARAVARRLVWGDRATRRRFTERSDAGCTAERRARAHSAEVSKTPKLGSFCQNRFSDEIEAREKPRACLIGKAVSLRCRSFSELPTVLALLLPLILSAPPLFSSMNSMQTLRSAPHRSRRRKLGSFRQEHHSQAIIASTLEASKAHLAHYRSRR